MPENREPFERLLKDIYINSTLEEDLEDEIVQTAQKAAELIHDEDIDTIGILNAAARRLRAGRCGREPPFTVQLTAAPRSPEELAAILDLDKEKETDKEREN